MDVEHIRDPDNVLDSTLDLSALQTEGTNGRTSYIDRVSTLEMCRMINTEDQIVASSVTPYLPDIARAVDLLFPRVRQGGRVIYMGAGTSGRYMVLSLAPSPQPWGFSSLLTVFLDWVSWIVQSFPRHSQHPQTNLLA